MVKNAFKSSSLEKCPDQLNITGFLSTGIIGTQLQRTIEWADTDAAGHHHNSVIMRFVEAAEAKLFRELGHYQYFGIAPRVRHEIDYRSKLFFGQTVSTALILTHIGTSSMEFSFKVWGHSHEKRQGMLAAEGKFVTVCVPVGYESSAPWSEELRAALEAPASEVIATR
ncbi:thioesterase [Arthrobacter sp. MYb227]|uniref:acyl-CoA thioesterase n=1 Tax=Arthrobacter sp. MYb227 TaxID=1848601 RepID=UPI000CFC17B7|nr:thioesterase family protein [Arthrobacter sp. MYb227]PQZ86965.1 thioesterase [Arthrobacter sp. MYb227]